MDIIDSARISTATKGQTRKHYLAFVHKNSSCVVQPWKKIRSRHLSVGHYDSEEIIDRLFFFILKRRWKWKIEK